MRIDVYTKVVLTIIAVMLTVIACKPLVSPKSTARAEGPLAGVQFVPVGVYGDFFAFDTRTGNYWYLTHGWRDSKWLSPPKWDYYGKIGDLGQPIVGWEKQWKESCPKCEIRPIPPAPVK